MLVKDSEDLLLFNRFSTEKLAEELASLNVQQFFKDLTGLREEHNEQHVAYRLGKQICIKEDKDTLLTEMREKYPFGEISVFFIH